MKLYLDASVVNVYLFGVEKEPDRYPKVVALFDAIHTGRVDGVVSVYTIQEICVYCRDFFPEDVFAVTAHLAVQKLMNVRLQLVPLLTREEKVRNSRAFSIRDPSDQPHVILAHLHQCDALVAYDDHFEDTSHLVPYLQPDEVLTRLEAAIERNSKEAPDQQ